VAPIALYPDALLSQVLVACTYPLELVEAEQWLQRNRNLQGAQLVDAARKQNWDPSIQALVVFPDVLNALNSDIRWATDLGNAFLAQQADVMNAVQRLRSQAMAAGKLNSSPQETVTTQTQGGQTVIDIQPANPAVVYVPVYNPEYIWGPPAYGYYPPLFYPNFGFGFGAGIYIGSFFGGLGWGGWGWGPNWFSCSIFQNVVFFNHFGFHNFHGQGGFGGSRSGVWAHNPDHRLGVPYSSQTVANRFGGNFAGRGGAARAGAAVGQFGGQRFTGKPGQASSQTQPHSLPAVRPNLNSGSAGGNHFGGSQPVYRSSPGGGGTYRPTPSYGGYGAVRSMPTYRPNPGFSGGGMYRATPSFRGNMGGFGGGGFGGGGFRGGGGGFHGGGGGFHGGGRR
jgi:hypothetical protein